MYTPNDYSDPEWNEVGRIHDWRNYINTEVRAMWDSFTDEQRQALARQAEDQSGNEEWD